MTVTMLNAVELNQIMEVIPRKVFQIQAYLFFEKQIPTAGAILIEGNISLTKKNKESSVLSTGALFGVHELMNNTPSKVGAFVESGTVVCLLDRSSILEIMEGQNNKKLASLLNEVICA